VFYLRRCSCPECSTSEDVDFLADFLDSWDDSPERDIIKEILLNLPLGILTKVKDKRVVKVEYDETRSV
jgi:hypothetical protein